LIIDSEVLARKYGDQSMKPSDEGKELADELADVMFVLVCLANQTGINLEEAFQKNLEKKTARDQDLPVDKDHWDKNGKGKVMSVTERIF